MTADFQFEELPLIMTGGCEAAQVNGTAAIAFRLDGSWHIDGLRLDGFRKASVVERANGKPHWIVEPIELDAGTPIYLMIYDRLEHEWRDKVEDFVSQCLEEDRGTGRESRANLRLVAAE